MSLFDKGKRAAKFSFVTMPLSILGIHQLKMGHEHLKALWISLFNPICPECNKGIMVTQSNISETSPETSELHPWVCNRCGFGVLEKMNIQALQDLVIRYRNERIKATLNTINDHEKHSYAREHQLTSRLLFGMSFLTTVGFFYLLASGSSFLLALNWLSFSFALWIFGMKRSYRCWQIRSSHIFEEGAFWYWFKHERWWV